MIIKPETKIEDLTIEEKLDLVYKSDGYLIDILENCKIESNIIFGKRNGNGLCLDHSEKLTHLPKGLEVSGSLHLVNCKNLIEIPGDLVVGGSLFLQGCYNLKEVPKTVKVKRQIFLPTHLEVKIKYVFHRMGIENDY